MIFHIEVNKVLKTFFLFLIIASAPLLMFADQKTKSVVDADKVFYDKKSKKIIAVGNVEVFRDGLLIKSDKLTYDQSLNKISALGNVKVVDADGREFFGNEIELLRNLKKIVMHDLKSQIDGKLTFGAKNSSYETNSKIIRMHKASVTTCEICKNNKPQWVFNSHSVEHDYNGDRVHHYNSFLKVYGLPVFYVPYFSHLTPNAKPRSGLLYPSYRYRTIYGNGVELKYYHRFSNHSDLIYNPIVTEKENTVHQLSARKFFSNSSLKFNGSYTSPKEKALISSQAGSKIVKHRYRVETDLQHSFNDSYSLDMKLNRVSDKSFLDQYYSRNKNYLTSLADLNYNENMDYGNIKSLYFQGLRTQDDSKTTPYALPLFNFHKENYYQNKHYIMEINALNLQRESGSNVVRSVASGQLERQLFFANGIGLSNSLFLRGDMYKYSDLSSVQRSSGVHKTVNRVIPAYEVNVQYPLISQKYGYISLVQPLMQVVATPNSSKNNQIINEDSLNVEISDANLFSNNRYSGFDKFEDGSRINYGLVGSIVNKFSQKKYYHYMVGQSYRLRKPSSFGIDSGMINKFSDIVGNFGVTPIEKLKILYRYRFDQRDNVLRRSEMDLGYKFVKLSFNYKITKYNYKSFVDDEKVIKSMALNPKYEINKNWTLSGNITRNGTRRKSFFINTGAKIIYDGQCSWISLNISKDHTKSQMSNNKKATSFVFEFIPKGI
ncbi:MAG: LPS assembly protein LptD [Rickettsiales bacterium]